MSAKELVPVGTKLPKDKKRELRIRAAEEGTTMSAYLRELAERDLEG